MTTALSIADQGHGVHLLEKAPDLGGMARRLRYTLEGMDVQAYLDDLIRRVYQHPRVHVSTDATIAGVNGYVGNFLTRVKTPRGSREIKHGVAVIATGAAEYRPTEYLYGQDERVRTQLELEEGLAAGDDRLVEARSTVMIQCVGCRQEDRNYCSRVCCSQAVKNALRLKDLNPEMEIYILFRDMRTYGLKEDFYREAAERDVKFIRYVPEDKPVVEPVDGGGQSALRVAVTDPILGKKLAIDADSLVLAAAVIPGEDSKKIAQLYQVSLGPDGFFKEAHVKLRPVEFGTDGVFLCGTAHYPKHIQETINQAYGAAGRVVTLLSHDTVVASGSVCEVDERDCIACGECVSACTYGAVELRETGRGVRAGVNPVLCKGDGLCNSVCPTGAISLKHFTDDEFLSQIEAALGEGEDLDATASLWNRGGKAA